MSKKTKTKKVVKEATITEGQKAALEKMEKKLEDIDKEKKKIEKELEASLEDKDKTQKQIKIKEERIDELKEDLDNTKKEVEQNKKELEKLKTTFDKENNELKNNIKEKERMIEILQDQKNDLSQIAEKKQEETKKAVEEAHKAKLDLTVWEEKFKHWRRVLESELKFKVLFLVEDTGERTLEEISKTVGMPVQYINRIVSELEKNNLIKIVGNRVKAFLM